MATLTTGKSEGNKGYLFKLQRKYLNMCLPFKVAKMGPRTSVTNVKQDKMYVDDDDDDGSLVSSICCK